MKLFTAVVIVVALFSGCEGALDQKVTLNPDDPIVIQGGLELFGQHCASCHGAEGEGAPIWEPSIQGFSPVRFIVEDGRGAMPPIALDDKEMQMVEAFMRSQRALIATLDGPQVYERLCAGCHGEQGEGTAHLGMQLRYDDDPFSTYWTRRGRAAINFDYPMPAYDSDFISDQQLDEMWVWISSLDKPTEPKALYLQYCANCHGSDGGGGPSGESIRGESVGESLSVIREGEGGRNYGGREDYMTAWNKSQLTDAEARKIAEYVNGL